MALQPTKQTGQVLYQTDPALSVCELLCKTAGLVSAVCADRPGHSIASDRILTKPWLWLASDLLLVSINNLACG
jgi:hypothetical protein